MKIHYIYILIGISTFALNLILTLNIIRKHTNEKQKEAWDSGEIITFSLSRGKSIEDNTTAVVPCDDTVLLE